MKVTLGALLLGAFVASTLQVDVPKEEVVATINKAWSEYHDRLAVIMRAGAKTSAARRYSRNTKSARSIAKRNKVVKMATMMLISNHSDMEMTTAARMVIDNINETMVPGNSELEFDPCPHPVTSCPYTYAAPFRTHNGECNNMVHRRWGASVLPLVQLLPKNYTKYLTEKHIGINPGREHTYPCPGCPDAGDGCQAETVTLPNERFATSLLHPDQNHTNTRINQIFMQFAQFLDHDISLSPEHEHLGCCESGSADEECLTIAIPPNDPFFGRFTQTCMEFTRTVAFCLGAEEVTQDQRENMNVLTSFLDASQVYGNDEFTSEHLRSFEDGKLLLDENNLLVLRHDERGGTLAGDIRSSEMPALTVLHTLFAREHNRLAEGLKEIVTFGWTDELLYQNARRILIAQWQKIVYKDWLPITVGTDGFDNFKLEVNTSLRNEYDPTVNPSVIDAFNTAAFRFGHTLVQGLVEMYNTNGSFHGNYVLSNNFFNDTLFFQNDGATMQKILNGLIKQKIQSYDRFVTGELSTKLFKTNPDFGEDLLARNLGRGRDHGLAGYAAYYRLLGPQDDPNREMKCWSQRPQTISEHNWELLKYIYRHPQDIELFSAGLFEDTSASGGLLGHTFRTIVAMQFEKLKLGDRFFFTNSGQPGSFTPEALPTIMRRSLADIICDNTDIKYVQTNVFLEHDAITNPMIKCGNHQGLNLNEINTIRPKIFPFIIPNSSK